MSVIRDEAYCYLWLHTQSKLVGYKKYNTYAANILNYIVSCFCLENFGVICP